MSATYNSRIVKKLNDVADLLDEGEYHNHATSIRNIASKVLNLKEGAEWNTYNPIGIPDADSILEDVLLKYKLTMSDAKKKSIKEKSFKPSNIPITNLVEVIKNLENLLK